MNKLTPQEKDLATNKANSWVEECFPELFDNAGNVIDGPMWSVPPRFYISLLDALGVLETVDPPIMHGLAPDQIDDVAIYYALKRTDEYMRSLVESYDHIVNN